MPFKFKMQKVLDYREQLEEEAKVKLADAQAKHSACCERLDRLVAEIREAEAKGSGQVLQAADYWLHEQYLKGLYADYKTLALQEKMMAQMVNEARNYLATCAIERKMLDKLKERQKIQYIRQEQKQEMNFNDEIATIRRKTPALQNN